MSAPGVSPSDALKQRARAVRAQFAASGTRIKGWAAERGFNEKLVGRVLKGESPCNYGESHRIAVALGIKAEAPPPGAQPEQVPDRLEGVRS